MMDWALFQALNHFIPAAYMPLILIILSAFLAFEQWLASTKRIKANSTLQLIVGFVQYFLGKEKGKIDMNPLPLIPTPHLEEVRQQILKDAGVKDERGPEQPAQAIRPEPKRGPEVTGGTGVDKPSGESGSAGSGNPYIPDWIAGKGGPGPDTKG
jgi:hypothetical protein